MATNAEGATRAELFWHRMAIGLAVFIVLGFLQFALRGFVDPVAAPFWVHLHGVAMLAWLALLIVQPTLVSSSLPSRTPPPLKTSWLKRPNATPPAT